MMADTVRIDRSVRPARITVSEDFNICGFLVDRHLAEGRADKPMARGRTWSLSYGELHAGVCRTANLLRSLGVGRGDRVMLLARDGPAFFFAFLGAVRLGAVVVPTNTFLRAADYAYMLADSNAKVVLAADGTIEEVIPALLQPGVAVEHRIAIDKPRSGWLAFDELLAVASPECPVTSTTPNSPCFWLYSSGSTGRPKGTVHVHSSLVQTAELYAVPVLGIAESDITFSAAKLFFAYGLGNGLTFPMAVGATSVLMAERPSPAAVSRVLSEHRATIFYGVPTLYNAMLASNELPGREVLALRRCVSAGEPLPQEIGRRWSARLGVDILDGIGSTEMLHIFLSNRPDEVRYGTTGKPIPGYPLKIVDEEGRPVRRGEVGDLLVGGQTSAAHYWNNREHSRSTFNGIWTRTGDKYFEDEDGYYVYCGRSDDMLKVSGMYVSPAEVEAALIAHEDVFEAAVVGAPDADGLIRPKAFVVVKPGTRADGDLALALEHHAKAVLAPFKRPRWIAFVDELPKTATGKIQRFKLREVRPG
jgi:benzoate-CoA ligase